MTTKVPYQLLEDGTAGQLITWDAGGVIAAVATGTAGQVLTSNGAGAAPTFQAAAGGGNVTKVGTPVDNQIGVWTGDGTIEGDAALTFDTTTNALGLGGTTSGITSLVATATASGTLTLPAATDQLVARDTTDTLTNKTIAAGSNTISGLTWTGNFANGTDGEIPTFNSSGAPAFVATGTAGHVLTSNGAGAAPTFQAASGGVTAASQAEMEAASSTTVYVSPGRTRFHPGVAKFWVHFTGSTIVASHNVTSVTNTGAGNQLVNITTGFSSANWAFYFSADDNNADDLVVANYYRSNTAIASGSIRVRTKKLTSGSSTITPVTVNTTAMGFGDQ